ncbi:MAG: hypothetical protein CFE41_11060 [Burkholderiales bacterium PBB2]|nr:MAG: hypothetical protein CFE41_11060 [Burkholderiales bacterium PBB2]
MKLWGDGGRPGWRGLLRAASCLLAYLALAVLDRLVALRLDLAGPGLADGALALSWLSSESLRFHWQLALAVLILLQQDRWRHAGLWCLALLGVELGLSLIERAPLGFSGAALASLWAGPDESGSPWPRALQLPLQALLMLGLASAWRWPWVAPAGRSRVWHAVQRAGWVALSAGVSEALLMWDWVSPVWLLLSALAQVLALSLSWVWLAAWLQPAESNRRECGQLGAVAACGVALSVALGWQWQREQELDQRQQLEAQAVQRGMALQAQMQALEQELRLLRRVLADSAPLGDEVFRPLARGMLDADPALNAVLWQPAALSGLPQGLRTAPASARPPIRTVPAELEASLPALASERQWRQLWEGAARDEFRCWSDRVSGTWLVLRAGTEPGAAWVAAGLNWERMLEAAAQRSAQTGERDAELHMQISDSAQGLRASWPERVPRTPPDQGGGELAPAFQGSWALWGQAQHWQRSVALTGAGTELQLQLSARLSPWRESTPGHASPASGFAVLWGGLLLTGGLQLALSLGQQRRRRQSVFGQERQLDLEQSLLMLDYSVQQFHRQSEQLHALLDATPVGYAAFDAPGQGLYSNKAFAVLSGAEVDAPTPSLAHVLHQMAGRASPAAVAAELRALAQAVEAEPVAPLAVDGLARVRRLVLLPEAGQGGGQGGVKEEARELELRLLSFEQGAIAHVLLLLDVSEEQRLERSKAQFINNAAHEIRTPLTVILGAAELLQAMPPEAEAMRQQCSADILRKAQELQNLVRGLLDLSELDAQGARSLRCQALDPVPWLQQLCQRYHPQAPGLAPEFHNDGEASPGLHLTLDTRKMERALQHLLANAYEFSSPGSPVRVTLAEAAAAPAGSQHSGPWLELAVHDQGMGMSPEQVARAFDRFYRADLSGSRPGFGLGLSYVRRLVELHGGQVHIDSALQQGCVVRLCLPAMRADVAPAT